MTKKGKGNISRKDISKDGLLLNSKWLVSKLRLSSNPNNSITKKKLSSNCYHVSLKM